MTGQLMGCLRPGGSVHVYGALSAYTASVHPLAILAHALEAPQYGKWQ